MRTKRIIQIVVGAIMVLGFVWPAGAREAEYNGKALSEWLSDLNGTLTDKEFYAAQAKGMSAENALKKKHEEAREAIRQMGTNGLPVLLDLVGAVQKNHRKVAGGIKGREIRESLRDSNPDSWEAVRGMAVDGFGVLGTNAEPAIPALDKLLHGDPNCQLEVTKALLDVGPKGFEALTNVVNNPADVARNAVIWTIGEYRGGDPKTITRILVGVLQDEDWANRGNAARFLAGRDAELAVPALISLLDKHKDDIYTVEGVSQALGSYGLAAKAAVPTLFAIYTNAVVNTDQRTAKSWGEAPLWALKAIDMETAKQAEEFLVNSGPLNYARYGYSRTKLTNGLELIAGGYVHTSIPVVTNRFLSSAELLDPKTGRWTETGEMNNARYDHKATLLPDGKVLVEGGYGSHPQNISRQGLSSKELYDPTTGIWTVVTNK